MIEEKLFEDVLYSLKEKVYFCSKTKELLNGKYIKDDAYFHYAKGKMHRIDGPAFHRTNGVKTWWLNGFYINDITMENWLIENDIPLDWNIWSDLDKMLFALHWSDYNG